MRFLKYLLNTILILLAIFFIGGFFIPDDWSITRSTTIKASPEHIYHFVSNFRQWEKWSPWNSSKDSSLKYSYEGPKSGVGAKQTWSSDKMGSGWMTFTEADPKTGIAYDLFIDMGSTQSQLQGKMVFEPKGDETLVTWTDKGSANKNYIRRWMSLMLRPMLGREMDKGLAGLKALAEKK